jgi:outer membrane protein OmpA-like peptidoglycan-associated protein
MKYNKITLLAILSLIACISEVSAQKKEGDIERKAENYQKAISYYRNGDFSSSIALRLARCYAMLEQTDSALYYLNFVIDQEKENFPVSGLDHYKEFEKLKKCSEWEKLVKKCQQFNDAYIAKLNISLRDSILEMRRIDNSYQEKFDSILNTKDSITIQSFKEEWKSAVKENDLKLSKIIDAYGWPTRELVGNIARDEVFFIVQHSSDLKLQKKCLVLFKQIEENDINHLIQIAYLEDRVLVKNGQKQLYGTQYKNNKLYPINDPDNLNKRRAQIGLAPIQFISANPYSQNLIPNYSFELYSGNEYPRYLREVDGGWRMVGGESWTKNENDTIKTHSLNFNHIGINFKYFNSHSGNAYVRYGLNQIKIPSLFQVELKNSLIKGEEYLIEYYIRTEAVNKQATTSKNDVCIILSRYNNYSYKIFYNSNVSVKIKEKFKMTPDIYFYENRPVADFSEWTKISNKYIAKGGEKYFLIGRYGWVKNNYPINLDNISVLHLTNDKIDIENTKVGEAVVLENISFELNSDKLTSSSFATLNQVVELFSRYPNLLVEIAGHTDNTGISEANHKLSENRAKSVVEYLISAGVEPNRLKAKGYGESFPISDNTMEKDREKNRRVEFKILQR